MRRNPKASNYSNLFSSTTEMSKFLFGCFDEASINRPNAQDGEQAHNAHFKKLALKYLSRASLLYRSLLFLCGNNKEATLKQLGKIYAQAPASFSEWSNNPRFKVLRHIGFEYINNDKIWDVSFNHNHRDLLITLFSEIQNFVFSSEKITANKMLIAGAKEVFSEYCTTQYNDQSDRAILLFELIYIKMVYSQTMRQSLLFNITSDAVKALFYFDQKSRMAVIGRVKQSKSMENQFRQWRLFLTDLNSSEYQDVKLLLKQTWIIWRKVTGVNPSKESPSNAYARLFDQIQAGNVDGALELLPKLDGKQNIWDTIPAPDAIVEVIEAPVATQPSINLITTHTYERSWLQATLNVFLLLLFLAPIVILVLATKGVFGLALPWVLPKCIALAAAISIAATVTLVASDKLIRNKIKSIFNKFINGIKRLCGCTNLASDEPILEAVHRPRVRHHDRPESNTSLKSITTPSSQAHEHREEHTGTLSISITVDEPQQQKGSTVARPPSAEGTASSSPFSFFTALGRKSAEIAAQIIDGIEEEDGATNSLG